MSTGAGRTIIADTSCLIILFNIGELDILRRLFGEVTITDLVLAEFGQPVPEWVRVEVPQDGPLLSGLLADLDAGEATAIALAEQIGNCLLILDDLAARAIAVKRKLDHMGTLGVLTQAKRKGLITAVLPYKRRLQENGFRMSEKLLDDWVAENGEREA